MHIDIGEMIDCGEGARATCTASRRYLLRGTGSDVRVFLDGDGKDHPDRLAALAHERLHPEPEPPDARLHPREVEPDPLEGAGR